MVRKSPLESRPPLFQSSAKGLPELASQQNVNNSKPLNSKRVKRTFHLLPEEEVLLSDLQASDHRCTGQRPSLSDLIGEGIRLVAEKRNLDS